MTWTASDNLRLCGMVEHGKRYATIAKALDRPYQTVVSQAELLQARRLTDEQLQRLWSYTWPEMAFEDDPCAPQWEPPLRDEPVPERSLTGCAAGMVADA